MLLITKNNLYSLFYIMQDFYNIEGFYSKTQQPRNRSFSSTRSSFSRSMSTSRSIPTRSFSASRSVPVNRSIPKTSSFTKPSTSFTKSAITRKVEDDKKLELRKHKRRHSHDKIYYSPTLGGTGGGPFWGWTYWNYYPLYPLVDYIPMFPVGSDEFISNEIVPSNEDIRNNENDKKDNKKEIKKSNESDSSEKSKTSKDNIENFTFINLLLNILK